MRGHEAEGDASGAYRHKLIHQSASMYLRKAQLGEVFLLLNYQQRMAIEMSARRGRKVLRNSCR